MLTRRASFLRLSLSGIKSANYEKVIRSILGKISAKSRNYVVGSFAKIIKRHFGAETFCS